MSAPPGLDRESFQTLLANAFVIQESGIDTQLVLALTEVQRLIASDKPDVDQVIHLIAEQARRVSGAAGIAIALLKEGQLVYLVGIGSAATYVGQHMNAVLNTPAHKTARAEILRCENAWIDTRIEAEICRQFGANALLILPIIRERALAGVLQILFSEVHTFSDQEVRTYRLLGTVIEDAIFRQCQLVARKDLATPPATVSRDVNHTTFQIQKFSCEPRSDSGPATKPGCGQGCGAAKKSRGLHVPAKPTTPIVKPLNRPSLIKLGLNMPVLATVLALAVASWNAYDHRQASHVYSSRPPAPSIDLQPSLVLHNLVKPPSPPHTVEVRAKDKMTRNSESKRTQLGQSEVHYIGEDVTVRHFTLRPASQEIRTGNNEVAIGKDVTVRYLTSKPAVTTLPVSGTTHR